MKKIYSKPIIDVIEVYPINIVALSKINEDTTQQLQGERRRNSVWDEYENE